MSFSLDHPPEKKFFCGKNRLTKQQNCRVSLVNDSFDFWQNKSHTIAAHNVCFYICGWSFQHNCCHNKGTTLNSRVKDIIYRSYHTFYVTSHCVTVIDYDLLGNCFAYIFRTLKHNYDDENVSYSIRCFSRFSPNVRMETFLSEINADVVQNFMQETREHPWLKMHEIRRLDCKPLSDAFDSPTL